MLLVLTTSCFWFQCVIDRSGSATVIVIRDHGLGRDGVIAHEVPGFDRPGMSGTSDVIPGLARADRRAMTAPVVCLFSSRLQYLNSVSSPRNRTSRRHFHTFNNKITLTVYVCSYNNKITPTVRIHTIIKLHQQSVFYYLSFLKTMSDNVNNVYAGVAH